MNNQQKQQVLEQLKAANNVLVTVSANPTVDELAASVGLTLVLNKMNKHATTVFSGVVPSTIEFLQPEQTIETTTDSLRDFIIALDKSKADKLRYKVEDDVVRIFITPYHTTITDKDLEFSHGDFNVDVVIGLGVTRREELDMAITSHGRILHDATVIALTKRENVSDLGSINWQEQQASSLCEMVTALAYELQPEGVDGQMATALLTGIIAETDRFKNDRTTPQALAYSSRLMTSGANQQLIAEKLEEPAAPAVPLNVPTEQRAQSADGELAIDHGSFDDPEIENINIDEHGNLNVPRDEDPYSSAPPDSLPAVDDMSQEDKEDDGGRELLDPIPPTQGSGDENEQTLKDPDTSMRTMSHAKTIVPPVDPNRPQRSDKPFDLQEALQTSASMDGSYQPVVPEQVSQPQPDPAPQVPAPAPEPAPEPMQPVVQPQVEIPQPEMPVPPPMPPQPEPVIQPAPEPEPITTPPTPEPATPEQGTTPFSSTGDSLADLERSIGSRHASETPEAPAADQSLEAAQKAVAQAADALPPQFPTPQQSVGAQPVDLHMQPEPTVVEPTVGRAEPDAQAPPPVPPPMMPQFYDADGKNNNPFLNPDQH